MRVLIYKAYFQLRQLGYFLKNFYHKSVHVSMEFIEFWVAGKARLRMNQ